jgi:lipoyl(octanoyl) transferase
MRTFSVIDLGKRAYGEVHELQARLQEQRIRGEIGDTVLAVEHFPVVTLGRASKQEHLLFGEERLRERGVELFDVGRGGDVTFHGPGQLVLYPIISLDPDRRDVRKYVWTLEETMIRTAGDYGLAASRVDKLNGAWIGDGKVGAVGVRISRWVTMHGLALNVTTDLGYFDLIVPCGIRGKRVTSLERELGTAPAFAEVRERALGHFAAIHEARLVEGSAP